ncbi:AAA family ATPase [Marinifilum fragile]|uniref:AAA family ATPase n=1 Tax=Marinifilum fragile TaxID=570161 RepID=UPI002AA64067|nr:AAA family ATPase [Marinifilum fragile]
MDKIKLSNFRKIEDSWELELSPITLFTGTNNSGKSTILKALMLYSDFINSQNQIELAFDRSNSQKHKIDCYSNAINWKNSKEGDNYTSFSYSKDGFLISLKFYPLPKIQNEANFTKGRLECLNVVRLQDNASFTINYEAQSEYQLNFDKRFFDDNQLSNINEEIISLKELKNSIAEEIKTLQVEYSQLEPSSLEAIKVNHSLEGFKQKEKEALKKIRSLQGLIKKNSITWKPTINLSDSNVLKKTISSIIENVCFKDDKIKDVFFEDVDFFNVIVFSDLIKRALNFNVTHLSPRRNCQTRLYVNDETSSDIYELINQHSKRPIHKSSKAASFIKKWMKEFKIGENYNIKSIEGMASIIEILENNDSRNLVDKGFGAGQIFTILLKIGLEIDNLRFEKQHDLSSSIILIEEPEGNLHPALQAKLAELFYDAYKNYGIKFILETHSEYIIRKIQLIVKEDKLVNEENPELNNNPFKIYYFDSEKGPYEMRFREDGIFKDDFGPGFFDIASQYAVRLLRRN